VNLKLGSTVVTDSVNDINLAEMLSGVDLSLNVPFAEVEIVCSDEKNIVIA
jgi:hypothetical protein